MRFYRKALICLYLLCAISFVAGGCFKQATLTEADQKFLFQAKDWSGFDFDAMKEVTFSGGKAYFLSKQKTSTQQSIMYAQKWEDIESQEVEFITKITHLNNQERAVELYQSMITSPSIKLIDFETYDLSDAYGIAHAKAFVSDEEFWIYLQEDCWVYSLEVSGVTVEESQIHDQLQEKMEDLLSGDYMAFVK